MDRDERLAAEGTLREYLEGLDHAALTRIVTAEKWCRQSFQGDNGACCLVGHAEEATAGSMFGQPGDGLAWLASDAYEGLCLAQGIDRTVASIQLYASCLLRSREIASLEAFCPLAAREEASV